jgi:hypothetical protein
MSRLPPGVIVQVARELIERAEYPTIGLLIRMAGEDLTRTVMASIGDDDVLLKISEVLADTRSEQGG